MTIRSHFVTVGRRRVHYRRAGSGPPVVLLHPSPSWAKGIDRFTEVFAERFTAIAFDTPGYGHSDLLDITKPEIPDFAEALKDTLDALGIERCGVWGSHTGASIAMAFAVRYPERVSVFVNDGYPAYTDDYRADMTRYYLPPYEPKWDASHLLYTWHQFREQFIFSPTFRRHKENRTETAAPAEADAIQAGVLPRLITGEAYNVGYSAVFRYKGLEPIAKLKVPTCFGARLGDSLIKGFPLIEERMPKGAWTEMLPRDVHEAALRYREILEEHPAPADAPPPPAPARFEDRVNKRYLSLSFGQAMVHESGPAGGAPLVLLPQLPGDMALYDGLLQEIGKTGRRAIALDMPGNGDSEEWTTPPSIAAYASVLGEAADALGLTRFDLMGHQAGASVAAEFARHNTARVRKLVLLSPLAMPDDVRLALAPNYAHAIVPTWDGTHLISLWFALRGEQLFWPWYTETVEAIRKIEPDIDPKRLSLRLTGVLKHHRNHHRVWAAAFAYPLRAHLADVAVPTLVASAENDPFHRFAGDAAKLVAGARHETVSAGDAALAEVVATFLKT